MASYIYLLNTHIMHKFREKWQILGVKWCDFVVYSNGMVVVDRILADADYWENLEEKLEHFYLYHAVPELLSRRIFIEKSM